MINRVVLQSKTIGDEGDSAMWCLETTTHDLGTLCAKRSKVCGTHYRPCVHMMGPEGAIYVGIGQPAAGAGLSPVWKHSSKGAGDTLSCGTQ